MAEVSTRTYMHGEGVRVQASQHLSVLLCRISFQIFKYIGKAFRELAYRLLSPGYRIEIFVVVVSELNTFSLVQSEPLSTFVCSVFSTLPCLAINNHPEALVKIRSIRLNSVQARGSINEQGVTRIICGIMSVVLGNFSHLNGWRLKTRDPKTLASPICISNNEERE